MTDATAALAAELFEALGEGSGAGGRDLVRRALDFAAECHAGQERDDGTPYLVHPIRTALILARELGIREVTAVCAALLHDVLEDRRSVSPEGLRGRFGVEVADIVEAVTKPPSRKRSHCEVNAVYFPRLRAASELVRMAKLADRLDNVRDLPTSPHPRKRRRMIGETRSFYLPLVGALDDPQHRALLEQAYAAAIAVVEGLADD